MLPEFGRHHPNHHPPQEAHNRRNLILLTVCTKQRKRILANADVHQILRECWTEADRWNVGRYVILPDHIHLFCSPGTFPPSPLASWVAFWKNAVARRWPVPEQKPIWQRDFWDTQVRASVGYDEKWEYVRHNPVRHGLVAVAEDWSFQGELQILDW